MEETCIVRTRSVEMCSIVVLEVAYLYHSYQEYVIKVINIIKVINMIRVIINSNLVT